ncbi:hypothetical protein C8A03DRAFT_47089 [Achaetomium macrosporum]|uniref:Uncharacterized protein n=1 Tax=Achaetomium macrosporum TaxID=79813 RepID=A0AAN7C3C1_9PEZI|nr:hypothetical protein C8A03DRAFT_47089 [Achaetomium macrosporum]
MPEWDLHDVTESGADFLLDHPDHRATKSLFEQYCEDARGPERPGTRGLRNIRSRMNYYICFIDDERYGLPFRVSGGHDEVHVRPEPVADAGLVIPDSFGALITDAANQFGAVKRSGLVASIQEQKASLDEYFALVCTETVVLAHALLPDKQGRRLPAHTNRFISAAVLEAVHSTIKGAAIWSYVHGLLELLISQAADMVYRVMILREVSNLCHLEYERAQATVKRHAGNVGASMKINPNEVSKADPQLHCLLRLCQAETNASKAARDDSALISYRDMTHHGCPVLRQGDVSSLSETFPPGLPFAIHILLLAINITTITPADAAEFVRCMHYIRMSIDDSIEAHSTTARDRLPERGVNALSGLAVAVSSVQDLLAEGALDDDEKRDCFADQGGQCRQKKQEAKLEWTPSPMPRPQPPEKRVEQRRQKAKTRPSHSSVYEVTGPELPAELLAAQPAQISKVSGATADVFSTLFNSAQSRGSVSWVAFKTAMAELGFSVIPKFGSVYAFHPPDSLEAKKSFTVHRPHRSRTEGHLIHVFARRLKRTYGWKQETVEVATPCRIRPDFELRWYLV